jgi:hypothetical protein
MNSLRRPIWSGLISTAILMVAGQANAAGAEQGLIQAQWNIYGDGNLFFNLSGTHQGSPCPFTERWAFNTTTTLGKSWYAAFLMAYASGKTIHLGGNGNCVHGNTEEVADFYVMD